MQISKNGLRARHKPNDHPDLLPTYAFPILNEVGRGRHTSNGLRCGLLNVVSLDFGPIFAGITGTPVLGCRPRLRTFAGVGCPAVLIALRTRLALGIDGSALVLPDTTTGARTTRILCHTKHLLSENSISIPTFY